jgi:hypothetical protein
LPCQKKIETSGLSYLIIIAHSRKKSLERVVSLWGNLYAKELRKTPVSSGLTQLQLERIVELKREKIDFSDFAEPVFSGKNEVFILSHEEKGAFCRICKDVGGRGVLVFPRCLFSF